MKARQDVQLDAALLVPGEDGSHCKVTSFTTEGHFYELAIEGDYGGSCKFVSCSCPAFVQSGRFCKHIALGMLILPGIDFQVAESWEAKEEPLGLAPNSTGDPVVKERVGLEVEELVDSQPISSFDKINYYVDRLVALRDQMKPDFNNEEVECSLKRTYELYSEYVTHSSKQARQRQWNRY